MPKLVVRDSRFGIRGRVFEPGVHEIDDPELIKLLNVAVHDHPFLSLFDDSAEPGGSVLTSVEDLNVSTPDGLPRRRLQYVQADELPDELVNSTPGPTAGEVDRAEELAAGAGAESKVADSGKTKSRRQIEQEAAGE